MDANALIEKYNVNYGVKENVQQQCYTSQPSTTACSAKKHDGFYKIGQFALPCLLIVLYIALFAFMLIMMYRFVRAVEKIAKKFESGITINKQDSNLDNKV